MKAKSLAMSNSTFVYFWLGVLTGALIILATLMIKNVASNGAASLLGSYYYYPITSTSMGTPQTSTSMGTPQTLVDPLRTTSMGTPQTLTR